MNVFQSLAFAALLLTSHAPTAEGLAPVNLPDPNVLASIQHTGVALAGKLSHAYNDSLLQHPLYTKMATGGLLATTGDAIAQTKNQGEPYDKKRAASFMLFDMAYRATQHGCFPLIVAACHGQYIGQLSDQIPIDYAAAMEQTLASQLGIVPFMYYPVFFALTGFMQGLSTNGALERAKENFLPLMQRNLLFWIPVQFVQFGFIDEQLQIPFLSVAGLCWTFILSVAAGSTRSYNNKAISRQQAEKAMINAERGDKQVEAFTINKNTAPVSTN